MSSEDRCNQLGVQRNYWYASFVHSLLSALIGAQLVAGLGFSVNGVPRVSSSTTQASECSSSIKNYCCRNNCSTPNWISCCKLQARPSGKSARCYQFPAWRRKIRSTQKLIWADLLMFSFARGFLTLNSTNTTPMSTEEGDLLSLASIAAPLRSDSPFICHQVWITPILTADSKNMPRIWWLKQPNIFCSMSLSRLFLTGFPTTTRLHFPSISETVISLFLWQRWHIYNLMRSARPALGSVVCHSLCWWGT